MDAFNKVRIGFLTLLDRYHDLAARKPGVAKALLIFAGALFCGILAVAFLKPDQSDNQVAQGGGHHSFLGGLKAKEEAKHPVAAMALKGVVDQEKEKHPKLFHIWGQKSSVFDNAVQDQPGADFVRVFNGGVWAQASMITSAPASEVQQIPLKDRLIGQKTGMTMLVSPPGFVMDFLSPATQVLAKPNMNVGDFKKLIQNLGLSYTGDPGDGNPLTSPALALTVTGIVPPGVKQLVVRVGGRVGGVAIQKGEKPPVVLMGKNKSPGMIWITDNSPFSPWTNGHFSASSGGTSVHLEKVWPGQKVAIFLWAEVEKRDSDQAPLFSVVTDSGKSMTPAFPVTMPKTVTRWDRPAPKPDAQARLVQTEDLIQHDSNWVGVPPKTPYSKGMPYELASKKAYFIPIHVDQAGDMTIYSHLNGGPLIGTAELIGKGAGNDLAGPYRMQVFDIPTPGDYEIVLGNVEPYDNGLALTVAMPGQKFKRLHYGDLAMTPGSLAAPTSAPAATPAPTGKASMQFLMTGKGN